MNYGDIPVILLFLAAGYLLVIYVLLSVAQHIKWTRNNEHNINSATTWR